MFDVIEILLVIVPFVLMALALVGAAWLLWRLIEDFIDGLRTDWEELDDEQDL